MASARRCNLLVPHIAHVVIDRQFSWGCPGIGLHQLPQPADDTDQAHLSDTKETNNA